MPDVLADPDSLRELVHEIKTPLNAIIGFAEIIEGQYLGPADRGYRERAGEIVRQARLLLTAIDDLDFAAKVHSASGGTRERRRSRRAGRARRRASCASSRREAWHRRRRRATRGAIAAAVEPELADRLAVPAVQRAGRSRRDAASGCRLSAEQASDGARISISRPAALARRRRRRAVRARQGRTTMAAFHLRLVRGLARIAGGDLVGEPRQLRAAISRP